MRLKPKFGDYLVLTVVIVAAVLMLLLSYQRETAFETAVIIQNGIVIQRIDLNKIDKKLTIEYGGQYPGEIEAENGRIRFHEAQCPDKVCIQTGWISRNGQIAVCLPDNILIRIEGTQEQSDVDIQLH